jgi:protein-S-isoprenylcysteine O-methyltransferase Ste14
LYSAGFLEIAALSLVAANWFIGLAMVLGLIMILVVVIPTEEKNLVDTFGYDYEEYRKRTGRLLPRL